LDIAHTLPYRFAVAVRQSTGRLKSARVSNSV
jgi:hypothetical protein